MAKCLLWLQIYRKKQKMKKWGQDGKTQKGAGDRGGQKCCQMWAQQNQLRFPILLIVEK